MNLDLVDGNTLLNDKALGIIVVLRMNRSYMVYLRENYFLEINALQPFNMAVVVLDIEEAEEGS